MNNLKENSFYLIKNEFWKKAKYIKYGLFEEYGFHIYNTRIILDLDEIEEVGEEINPPTYGEDYSLEIYD